ncbi:LOW QUALITY PROTEIN: Retrotransposon protein [Phytophthora megakarya]|uniref:Retrotransposon protein n=1 Tax=Phytophthora megakarya TaxID=4795 RepID=A0A225VL70_9STRA|nr:LOW QUALITY PROTEIN: Retrotransposon protein [Phytophthora megakarya]
MTLKRQNVLSNKDGTGYDLRDVMRIYLMTFTCTLKIKMSRSTCSGSSAYALPRTANVCEAGKMPICVEEIPCIGDFVGRNGVRMDPDKVRVIKEWPVPRTEKEMESFLGTTVYVSRFCADFAQFAGPLHESTKILRPKETWHLTDHELECSDDIKRLLSTPPVLHLPDFDKLFDICMDASNFPLGEFCFKMRKGWNIQLHILMKPAELNYPAREQELLAIMHALRVWRVYLLDRSFTVETDHKSIETILTQKTTNRRVARWFNELAEFHPQFNSIPGDNNQMSDAVSRNPLVEHIAASTLGQTTYTLQYLLNTNSKEVSRYSVINGVLYYQTRDDVNSRLVIPDNEALKNRDLCENHDVVTAGHPGYFKTYLSVQKKYYWPKMSKYIQRYVNTYALCQRNKARQTKPPGLLQSLKIPGGRWVDISMDFVTALPRTTAGKDAVMVIVDHLTKRAKFIATNTTATAEDTATLFMVNYVKEHGVPKSIISDRDSKVTSKFWHDVITTLQKTHQLSSAFSPQTDGQTERANRFVEDYLRGVVNPAQNDWDEYLHLAEFAYNRRVHSSIGMSSF